MRRQYQPGSFSAPSKSLGTRLSICYISFAAHAEKSELKLTTQVELTFEHLKVSYEVFFLSYGVICLP